MSTKAMEAVKVLRHFIGNAQMRMLTQLCRGEEGAYFKDKLHEVAELVRSMPKTYETDGQGENAVAHLHYFVGGMDWFITERDQEAEQHQAFGLACIHEVELGYISLPEILSCGAELDLHWKPKTIQEIKAKLAATPA